MQGIGDLGILALIVLVLTIYSPVVIAIAVFMYNYEKPMKAKLYLASLSFVVSLFVIIVLAWQMGQSFEIWALVIAGASTLIAVGNAYHAFKHNYSD